MATEVSRSLSSASHGASFRMEEFIFFVQRLPLGLSIAFSTMGLCHRDKTGGNRVGGIVKGMWKSLKLWQLSQGARIPTSVTLRRGLAT